MSSKPKPTTTRPITAPERNATCRPRLRSSAAALGGAAGGVRRRPHADEAAQAGEEAAGQERDRNERVLDAHDGQHGQDDDQDDEDDATTLYCRRGRPSRLRARSWAISRIRSLPAGAARIIRNSTQAMASATTEEIGAIHQTASMFDALRSRPPPAHWPAGRRGRRARRGREMRPARAAESLRIPLALFSSRSLRPDKFEKRDSLPARAAIQDVDADPGRSSSRPTCRRSRSRR